MSNSAIYEGRVRHHRFKPVRHRLSYKVFSFCIDLQELDSLSNNLRFFSRNKFNLFSIYDRDHGSGKPDDISNWIRAELAKADLPNEGPIKFLFTPRMLGYAFNPISVYYCYEVDGRLNAILYAVRNTFGGRHGYLIPIADNSNEGQSFHQHSDKLFHVSPFIDMNMQYQFLGHSPNDSLTLTIKVDDKDGPLMSANFAGKRTKMSDKTLKRLFWRYPMMTLKIVGGIHWEAVKLFCKGLPLKKGDPDPQNPVTIVHQVRS